MFNSFKNTELFRYFIRVDLNKNVDKIIKQNKSNFSLIAGSIFSGSFSVLGTYFGMHSAEFSAFKKIFACTLLFSVLFVIGMSLFKGGSLIWQYIKNSSKKEKMPSASKIKEMIDDFDHIACDNILISQNFINAYNDKNISDSLKEFYFFEIIYYTRVSLLIIKKLFVHKDKCINDKNNTNRVHLFRIENVLNMLSSINTFLNDNKKDIKIDEKMCHSLDKEISDIGNALFDVRKSCNELKEEKYKNSN